MLKLKHFTLSIFKYVIYAGRLKVITLTIRLLSFSMYSAQLCAKYTRFLSVYWGYDALFGSRNYGTSRARPALGGCSDANWKTTVPLLTARLPVNKLRSIYTAAWTEGLPVLFFSSPSTNSASFELRCLWENVIIVYPSWQQKFSKQKVLSG